MAKTLMIIGAGAEQVPAYEAAKKRGLYVVGTDLNPDAPGFAYADYKLFVSTRDADATEITALKFHSQQHINGVMTIANDVPYTVARVAKAIGLPSISLGAAKCVTDKLLMKEKFSEFGVPCPWFEKVESVESLRSLIRSKPHLNFVLKPVDGRGARGVLLINTAVDLEWAFNESKRWGDNGCLIVEEFIPGLQLSTETFISDGKCYTPSIAERNYSRFNQFLPNIIEDGGTIPALIDAKMRVRIDELILNGAHALGIYEGIVKGDIIIDKINRPLIIELAARLSGGWFATHQIPAASGVDLVNAVISYSLGEKIDYSLLTPSLDRATAIRYWFPPPGKVQTIVGEDELKKTAGLISYGFFRKPGDIQPEIRMHPDRFGYVIVYGKNRAEALDRINTAVNSIHIGILE